MKSKIAFVTVLICVFLTSCISIAEAHVNINIQSNEKWAVDLEIAIPVNSVTLGGNLIAENYNELSRNVQQLGGEADWYADKVNEDGNVPYILELKGQGIETLSKSLFDDDSVIRVEERNNKRIIVLDLPVEDQFFWGAMDSSFTLSAGNIITHNGIQMDSNTVAWNQPVGEMYAEFEVPGLPSWIGYSLITGGVLLFFYGVSKIKTKTTVPKQEAVFKFCHQCGQKLNADIEYCPNCGIRQKH